MNHKAIRSLARMAYDANKNATYENIARFEGAQHMYILAFGSCPVINISGTIVTITIDGFDYIYDYKTEG